MLGEEGLHGPVGTHAVLGLGEPVALVVGHDVLHIDAAPLEGFHDLVALVLGHPWVVGTLDHHERRDDVVHPRQRRSAPHVLALVLHLGVAHEAVPGAGQERTPVVGERPDERDQVGRPHEAHGSAEAVGGERDAHQGGVAAVRPSVDRQAVGVGDALLHGPVDGVDQVVVHLPRELALGRVHEVLAESRGPAVVHLQHGVAPVGQELRHAVVAPGVAAPRTAVHVEHHGQALGLHPPRGGEVAVHREPVAARDLHRGHGRELIRRQPRPRAEQELALAGLAVEQVRGAGVDVAVEGDGPHALVGVAAGDARVAVRDLPHPLEVAGEALVERVHHKAVAQVGGAQQRAVLVADDGHSEVGHLVLVEHGLLAGGDVDGHQARAVRTLRAAHPHHAAVGVEPVGLAAVLVVELGQHAEVILLGVPHQQLVIAAGSLGVGAQHLAVAVSHPPDDVAGVLCHGSEVAGAQVEPLHIEHRAVAPVGADDDLVGGGTRHRHNAGPHAVERSEIAGGAVTGHVHHHHVVVLVATLVLAVQDVLRVAGPRIAHHPAVGVAGHGHGIAALDRPHPHVQQSVERREPRDHGAVG